MKLGCIVREVFSFWKLVNSESEAATFFCLNYLQITPAPKVQLEIEATTGRSKAPLLDDARRPREPFVSSRKFRVQRDSPCNARYARSRVTRNQEYKKFEQK